MYSLFVGIDVSKDSFSVAAAMDNLSTRKAGSLYETFPPEEAKQPRDRFEFVCTLIHGSRPNNSRDRTERDDLPMFERPLRFS
jgi:hypothetical protein